MYIYTLYLHIYYIYYIYPLALWLFNIAMERSTIFKDGKPSISIRAIYFPWRNVSHNQRVYIHTHTQFCQFCTSHRDLHVSSLLGSALSRSETFAGAEPWGGSPIAHGMIWMTCWESFPKICVFLGTFGTYENMFILGNVVQTNSTSGSFHFVSSLWNVVLFTEVSGFSNKKSGSAPDENQAVGGWNREKLGNQAWKCR